MNFLTILAGLAAIPKLISKIEQLMDVQKKLENQKWIALSIATEKRLKEAESPEEIRKIADELANLIRTS